MNAKVMIFAIMLIVCIASMAWADGKFYGTVRYKDCNCREASGGDAVHIWQIGGVSHLWNIVCDHFNPTGTYASDITYAPGWYYLAVSLAPGSDCDVAFVQYVYHGNDDQEVNLEVRGPGGDPTRPGGN